ncbi:adenylate/guanylate cyclase domain-containing protein [Gordonia sp. TBRC 11910]|uniref:Adenylate/guanylate cyclase domain-containing protein n=1 Tax=Gordonia asplenii TaxID=2725283 RepID=A0A848L464_9ACTN|nr:adenylate/guanylate cyclase domain-containing protein [Gordonia asplenii]NMO02418.1 adenylate/guanylate cyclase domain-containing protein [Gordonia asplenii]
MTDPTFAAHLPSYSRDELIAEIGADVDYAEKIWNAFGFAHQATDEKIFTQADVDAFAVFAAGAEQMSEGAQIAAARSIGQAMSRLADWQADQLLDFDRDPDISLSVEDMAKAIGQIQRLVWRRHLQIALQRNVVYSPDDVEWEVVVGFVDLVGFTGLSRRISFDDLEELLSAFEHRVSDEVSLHHGQVIKTLGDGVLFVNTDPAQAALTALAIAELSDKRPIPELRIGLAQGAVLARLGDVFGEPVNIAARLCGSARPGRILIDENLSELIVDDSRFRIRSIPTLSVRGYRRLRAHALSAGNDEESLDADR